MGGTMLKPFLKAIQRTIQYLWRQRPGWQTQLGRKVLHLQPHPQRYIWLAIFTSILCVVGIPMLSATGAKAIAPPSAHVVPSTASTVFPSALNPQPFLSSQAFNPIVALKAVDPETVPVDPNLPNTD